MVSSFIPQDVWQVQTDTEWHKSSLMHFAYFHFHRPWRDSLHIIFKWRQRGQLITWKWKSQAQMSLSFVFHLECADRPRGPTPRGWSHCVGGKIIWVVCCVSGNVCDVCTQNCAFSFFAATAAGQSRPLHKTWSYFIWLFTSFPQRPAFRYKKQK